MPGLAKRYLSFISTLAVLTLSACGGGSGSDDAGATTTPSTPSNATSSEAANAATPETTASTDTAASAPVAIHQPLTGPANATLSAQPTVPPAPLSEMQADQGDWLTDSLYLGGWNSTQYLGFMPNNTQLPFNGGAAVLKFDHLPQGGRTSGTLTRSWVALGGGGLLLPDPPLTIGLTLDGTLAWGQTDRTSQISEVLMGRFNVQDQTWSMNGTMTGVNDTYIDPIGRSNIRIFVPSTDHWVFHRVGLATPEGFRLTLDGQTLRWNADLALASLDGAWIGGGCWQLNLYEVDTGQLLPLMGPHDYASESDLGPAWHMLNMAQTTQSYDIGPTVRAGHEYLAWIQGCNRAYADLRIRAQ